MDHRNRRWVVSAVLSLLAASFLALAAFLPLYVSSAASQFDPDVAFTVTVVGWQSTVYPQLFGAALAVAAGVLAFRRNGLLSGVAGAFNLGVAWMLLTLSPLVSDTAGPGPGFWCLVAGVLLVIGAPLARTNTLLGRLPKG